MGLIIKILLVLLTVGSSRTLIFLVRKGNPKSDGVLMARLKTESQSPRQNMEKEILKHLKHQFKVGSVVVFIPFALALIAGSACLLTAWKGATFFFSMAIVNLVILIGLIFVYYLTRRTI